MENPDEEIEPIHDTLDISTNPFTLEEYRMAKSSIKEGKASGGDRIPQEVLKICDLDQIVLDFRNNALMNGEKLEQWSISNIQTS